MSELTQYFLQEEANMVDWLRQLVEWQGDMQDPGDFLSTLKVDLYPEEVLCFTPRGKVIVLPRDATPIDFAYAIHTEVGNKCVGAKVNGRMVPLRVPLKNGDVVEIITHPSAKPSRDWLKIARTSRALNKIRAVIRQEQQSQSLVLGRQILEKELRKYSLSLSKTLKSKEFEEILQENRLKSADDYCVMLGYGKVSMIPLLRKLVSPEDLQEKAPEKESRLGELFRRVVPRKPGGIVVKGIDDVFIRLANCCHPVPGEPIVGFITRGRGVTIHAKDCPKALAARRRPPRTWMRPEHPSMPPWPATRISMPPRR